MSIETKGICPLLQVFDMPTSVRFYRDVLDFEIVNSSSPRSSDEFGWCLLRRSDGIELMLNTAYDFEDRPPAPDPARINAHEDTCIYFGCPDVDAAYRHLLEKGLKIDAPRIAWYGMKQLYLKDPDGFSLCFQWKA
jgi:catechol 2,3-dioxygenase-like lactoylglutathione lyase family enzyme